MWSKASDWLTVAGIKNKTLDVEKQWNKWKMQGISIQNLRRCQGHLVASGGSGVLSQRSSRQEEPRFFLGATQQSL